MGANEGVLRGKEWGDNSTRRLKFYFRAVKT